MARIHEQAIEALHALLTTDLSPKQRCHVQWTLAAMREPRRTARFLAARAIHVNRKISVP